MVFVSTSQHTKALLGEDEMGWLAALLSKLGAAKEAMAGVKTGLAAKAGGALGMSPELIGGLQSLRGMQKQGQPGMNPPELDYPDARGQLYDLLARSRPSGGIFDVLRGRR